MDLVDIHEDFISRFGQSNLNLELDNKVIPSNLPFALQIYQRVWPPKNEHWFNDWHSFPLALSAEDEIYWSKE
jgi:hypothetical protein